MRNDYHSDVNQRSAPLLRQIAGLERKPPASGRTPEIVIGLPSRSIRVGVNPVGLLACGSIGAKLPSQRSGASDLPISLLAAYSGGAAPDLHRLPLEHKVSSFIRQ